MEPIKLSLKDIAAWGTKEQPANYERSVGIPALQRGLVWKPKQIELLWDSLMRGIPIGSFVVCEYIENQRRSESNKSRYHLLDGQQRANAIQLGFDDFSTSGKNSILWIDIDPADLPKESSRNFLFRVTTLAHPWGYTKSDGEGYLKASIIREWLHKNLEIDTSAEGYIRPKPEDMQPVGARIPVPMFFIINAYENNTVNREKLIQSIASSAYSSKKWAKDALEKLNCKEFDLSAIGQGIVTALKTTVLALQAPTELLKPSQQEENNSDRADITNIEHLFQRLNQQGTRLDGEELIYSLIKAYWPELTDKIDKISKAHMPASRLISLAFRVIFTEMGSESKLSAPQSVSSIRKFAKDEAKADFRKAILDFINLSGDNSLEACCNKIDLWLGTGIKPDVQRASWGLPPVLRSSIAYNNQELYLLLLLLAKNNTSPLNEMSCRMLTGVVTAAAWFGSDQRQIADALYKELHHGINPQTIASGMASARQFFCPLHHPDNVANFIVIPEDRGEIEKWCWENLYADQDEKLKNEKKRNWEQFLDTIRYRKDLLLYAQRDFIVNRFPEYDPARKDLWEAHNRPWDYDHILPYAYTYNMKSSNTYMNFCKQWCNNIGNFRAWPFEDNRSDQAIKAGDKLNDDLMKKSFIEPSELFGFNQGREILEDVGAAQRFAVSCKSRIVRMYREWFEQLLLSNLLPHN